MIRALLLLALLLATDVDSAGFGRGGGLTCPKGFIGGGLTPCVRDGPAFEFAPADGAGMGSACACTAVTGSRGEPMTLTRASSGTCLKGSSTTAAPGDLVTCGVNLPRVTPGGDGIGPLGLLVETAATNVVPRSEEFDDATFGDFTANGAAAPVLNGADAALAPDGALTADDYTFASTGATQGSARAVSVLTATVYSAQVWIRGVSGSGSMDLCLQTAAAPTATCSTCTFLSTAWSQCKVENVTAVAGGQIYVGNMSYLNGGIVRSANRVYVWGLDAEARAYSTSYVATAGAAATRQADSAASGSAMMSAGPDFSIASSVAFLSTAGSTTIASIGPAAPLIASVRTSTNTAAAYTIDSVSTTPSVAAINATTHRTALADQGGNRSALWDTVNVAAPAASVAKAFGASTDTAVTYVEGKLGQAASFNGSTSKIQTASQLKPLTWTMSCWINPGLFAAQVTVWRVGAEAAGQQARLVRDSATHYYLDSWLTPALSLTIAQSVWSLVTITYDGTNATGYVNGAAVSGPSSITIAASTGNFNIGNYSVVQFFQGLIDDTCMWDRALTAGEVASLYNSGAGLETMSGSLLTGLIHQWHLNGDSDDEFVSLSFGAYNAVTSRVCMDPSPSRCR